MSIEISLNQGKKYNNYQNRIKKGVEKKQRILKKNNKNMIEGFQNDVAFKNVYLDEAQNRISTRQTNAQESLTLQNLLLQYNDLVTQYQSVSGELSSDVYSALERSTSDDKYRGSTIQLPNGATGYVTEMGNYKWYPSWDVINSTQGKNGCPAYSTDNLNSVSNIDNSEVYNSPGQLLDTNPKLMVGRSMQLGQSCGNEGQNVYVNSMANNSTAEYNKCYLNYKKNPPPPQIPSIIHDAITYFPFTNYDSTDHGIDALNITFYQDQGGSGSGVGMGTVAGKDCLQFVAPYLGYAVSSAFNIPDQLSMAYWAYIPANSIDSETVSIGDGTFSGNTSVFQGDIYSNVLNTFIALPDFWTHGVGPYVINQWIHMAFCIDVKNRIIKYYINGKLYAQDNNAGSGSWHQLSSYRYTFGRASDTAGRYLPGGGISQFLSFNKMLSDQNVLDIYNYTANPSAFSDQEATSYDYSTSAMEPANVPYGNVMSFDNCKLYAQDNAYQYFGLNNVQSDGSGTCMVSNNYAQLSQFGEAIKYNASSVWNPGATGIRLTVNGGQMCIVNYDSYNREVPVKCFPDTLSPDCVNGGTINGVTATWGANCNGQNGYTVQNGNATNGVNSAVQSSSNKYQVSYTVGDGMTSEPTYGYNLLTYNGSTQSVCSGGGGWSSIPGYPYWTQETQENAEQRCNADPNCTAFDMVPNGQNNDTKQCAFFANQDITPGAYGNAYGCYKKTQQSGSGDPAYGCVKDFDITYQCGNTIKTGHIDGEAIGKSFLLDCSAEQAKCQSFLALQGDGNLCLYQGTPGNIIGGYALWCTMTNDKPRNPNPDWVATKGKYGRSYMVTGEYLNQGEWMGSDDGSCRLIMQEDGYASLVMNNTSPDCSEESYGYAGNAPSNAVYMLDQVGNKSLIGKVGYVDEDAVLREYPSSMIGKSTNYDYMKGMNSWGNDLQGMPLNNSTVESCKIACDDNDECNGYVFNTSNQCYLKNTNVYPEGSYISQDPNSDLYIRQPEVFGNKSCSKLMNPIDSIQYTNYLKGDIMTQDTTCGLVFNNNESQQLIDIENQLAALADQISAQINNLETNNININNQMDQDHTTIQKDLIEYKKIKAEIGSILNKNPIVKTNKNLMNNYSMKEGMLGMNDINTMVSDSDLNVLKNNYQYIFWSILALGAIIITINTLKK
jgi:hypothetical protein